MPHSQIRSNAMSYVRVIQPSSHEAEVFMAEQEARKRLLAEFVTNAKAVYAAHRALDRQRPKRMRRGYAGYAGVGVPRPRARTEIVLLPCACPSCTLYREYHVIAKRFGWNTRKHRTHLESEKE